MDPWKTAVGNLSGLRTLEQQIVQVLSQEEVPLTAAQIMARMDNPPDRETLTREIYSMKNDLKIEKAGEVPAPSGTPRQTVSTYRIASAAGNTQQGSEGSEPPRKTERQKRAEDLARELQVAAAIPARKKRGERINELVALLSSRGCPMTAEAILQAIPKVSRTAVLLSLRRAEKSGEVDSVPLKGRQKAYFVPAKQASGECESPASAPPVADPVDSERKIDFSLWPDGRLDIVRNGEVLRLAPKETWLLKRFLGDPTSPSPIWRTEMEKSLSERIIDQLAGGFVARRDLALAFTKRSADIDAALEVDLAAGRVIREEVPANHQTGRVVVGFRLSSHRAAPHRKPRRCLCCGNDFHSAGPMNRLCTRCRTQDVSPYAP